MIRLLRARIVGLLLLAGAIAGVVALRTIEWRELEGGSEEEEAIDRVSRPGPDSPDQAMEWVLLAYRDENGNIPRDGLLRARAQADVMRRAGDDELEREAREGTIAANAGITRGQWTWIGPANIGGRVRALVALPHAPSTLITGGVGGGIWKSSNGGANWRLIDDFMGNLAVSSIVYRPGEPNRLLAATGEGFFNADAIRGAGIFVSVDEGETWSQLPSTATSDFDFVNRVAFSTDGSVLLAATRTGLFRSTDLGNAWTLALPQANMMDVKFIAGSSLSVVASGRNRNAYYSVNGGVSWTSSGGLTVPTAASERVELAVSASSPNIVYASVDESSGQIWKSVDSGITYSKIIDSAHLSTQGWYDNALWVDPTNPNHVVTGGVGLSRSTNGAVSFSGISSCHADQHLILSDPGFNGTANRRVYFTSDGGVCKMEDINVNSVTSLRNGLGITQFYGAGGNAAGGRVMGGTQDNGTLRYDLAAGSGNWTTQHGSDGGFAAVDPTNASYLYGEIQNFRLHRSLTGSTPSEYIYGGTGLQSCTKAVPYQVTDACNGTANFISPFMLDPNEPNRLLAGGQSLWRTNDARTPNTATTGPTWAAIKAPTASGSNISAIAVAQGNSDIVWVGHGNGDVYVSLNGTFATPIWTRTDTVLPNRIVTSIAIDPTDPRIVYVSFGGFSPDDLWRTTNSGATWEDVTGSGSSALPDAPVRWVVLHPQINTWVYAATDVGVFASEDGGANWSVPHDGPSNVAVFQLFWMSNTLVAVTHGRGMYTFTPNLNFPVFARRPLSQAVVPGSSVQFTALAVGANPISYQWYRGTSGDTSSPIAGATSNTYTTAAVNATQSYWVQATNSAGTSNSTTATLTVLPWATLHPGVVVQGANANLIATQPKSQVSTTGGSVTFTVESRRLDVMYQWQVAANGGHSWTNVSETGPYFGSRTATLRVSPVSRSLNGARFRCVLTATGRSPQTTAEVTLSIRR